MIRAEGGMKMLKSIQSEQIKKFVAIVILCFYPALLLPKLPIWIFSFYGDWIWWL